MAPALYGITARTTTDELIRCDTVGSLLELPPLLEEYAAAFAGRPDVRVDLDTTPAA
jgi:hypothetical protein